MSANEWPVIVHPTYGCWVWQDKIDKHGYAIVFRSNRPTGAHRIVYEAELGPIPVSLVLDHVCRNRLCVSPMHLGPGNRS